MPAPSRPDDDHGDWTRQMDNSDFFIGIAQQALWVAALACGPILIPAFAVGRTQEVLYMIRELEEQKRIPVLPVIVDSPMASQATRTCADASAALSLPPEKGMRQS